MCLRTARRPSVSAKLEYRNSPWDESVDGGHEIRNKFELPSQENDQKQEMPFRLGALNIWCLFRNSGFELRGLGLCEDKSPSIPLLALASPSPRHGPNT